MSGTIRGMRAVDATGPSSDGDRDLRLILRRDGAEIEVAEIFNGISQTFDPTDAVEFTTPDEPNEIQRLRVGDVLTMSVTINV